MAGDNNLRDNDGYVYEKKGSEYQPKWDFWSQQQARDRGPLERHVEDHAEDGTPLRRPDSYKDGSTGSSGGSDALLLMLAIVIAVVALGILLAPVLFGVWLARGDWHLRDKNLKWAWVASWFVWGLVLESQLQVGVCLVTSWLLGGIAAYIVDRDLSPREAFNKGLDAVGQWVGNAANTLAQGVAGIGDLLHKRLDRGK